MRLEQINHTNQLFRDLQRVETDREIANKGAEAKIIIKTGSAKLGYYECGMDLEKAKKLALLEIDASKQEIVDELKKLGVEVADD